MAEGHSDPNEDPMNINARISELERKRIAFYEETHFKLAMQSQKLTELAIKYLPVQSAPLSYGSFLEPTDQQQSHGASSSRIKDPRCLEPFLIAPQIDSEEAKERMREAYMSQVRFWSESEKDSPEGQERLRLMEQMKRNKEKIDAAFRRLGLYKPQ